MTLERATTSWLGTVDLSEGALMRVGATFVVAVLVWFTMLALVAYRTRAGFVAPTAASQELGSETPALAHLVTNRWACGEEAAEATLVDMAARGYVSITHAGPEPEQAICAVVDPWPPELTPYERTVMSRVESVAGIQGAPLAALAHGSPGEAALWLKNFHAQVVQHARLTGLSRGRVSTLVRVALVGAALVTSSVIAAVAATNLGHPAFALLGLPAYALLTRSVWWVQGERDTDAGRQAAARWLGMREYLELHPSFAELPPTAVTLWHRYLAYAAALGVARHVLRALELGPGDDHKAWSAYGGVWRQVRVHYRRRPSWGWAPSRAIATGISWVAWAALVAFLSRDWLSVTWVRPTAALVVFLAGALGASYIAGGLADLVAPLYLDGLVLRVRERARFTPFPKRYEPKRTRTYVALDAGEGESTKAWVMAPSLRYNAVEGEVARIKVGRCFGQVRRHDTVQHRWQRQPSTARVDGAGTLPGNSAMPSALTNLPVAMPTGDTPS